MIDERLTAVMVDDFINDPVLAVRCIFGKLLPPLTPFQEARIWAMWTRTYMIDSSGYGTGKSMCIALVSLLRAMLIPERTIGILNKTVAQAKLVFTDYVDKWAKRSRFLRTQIAPGPRGGLAITHGAEALEVRFKNGSMLRAMTANPNADFQNLKTQSWSDGCFDEWTSYAFGEAFDKWVIGRVRKPVPQGYDPLHPAYRQHIYFSGTPQDTDHPCFNRVEEYRRGMAERPRDFSVMSWNHKHIPDTPDYYSYTVALSASLLDMARRLAPDEQERELLGRWTTAGAEWYTLSAIRKCAANPAPILLEREPNNDWNYFFGVDVARGGLHIPLPDQKDTTGGDDAAIAVWRVPVNLQGPDQHVYQWRIHGIESRQMAAVIHRLNAVFNPTWIVMDMQGGGLEIRDILRDPEQYDGKDRFRVRPIATQDDPSAGRDAERKLVFFSRGDEHWNQAGVVTTLESDLNNRMHQDFRAAIVKGEVMFMEEWASMPSGIGPRELRNMLNAAGGMAKDEKVRAETTLALRQLCTVKREVTKQGMLKLDVHGQPNYGSRNKKDSAYAMAYGFMGCWLWRKFQDFTRQRSEEKDRGVAIWID
jgi:hypothetical protein